MPGMSEYWRLLVIVTVGLLATLLSGCVSGQGPVPHADRPEVIEAGHPLSFPPPSTLHAVCAAETGRTRQGGEFVAPLPTSRVDVLDTHGRFTPDWNTSLGNNDPAYAFYQFTLDGYGGTCLVELEWLAPPDKDCAWVGLGNRVTDAWDWYSVPEDGRVYPESFDDYVFSGGSVLAAVVIAHDTQRVLTTMRLGTAGVVVPEESAFGIFSCFVPSEYPFFIGDAGLGNDEGYWAWVDDHFSDLGAHWTQTRNTFYWDNIESIVGEGYDWDGYMRTDAILRTIYSSPSGVQMVAVIDSGLGFSARDPMAEPTAHAAFLRAAVERYDGDGVGDADDNVSVRWWQIGNHVNDWLDNGRDVADYVDYFRHCRSAILNADPGAKLILARTNSSTAVDPFLSQVIDALAPAKEFDAINLIGLGSADEYRIAAAPAYRAQLDGHGHTLAQIWSCRNATWSGTPETLPVQTDTDQARSLVKRYVYNRANGVSKLFWNNLVDWAAGNGDTLNALGLVSDGQYCGSDPETLNHERPAYWAFKLLAEHTDNGIATLIGEVAGIHDEAGDLYAYEYMRDSDAVHFYIAWSDTTNQPADFPAITGDWQITSLVTDDDGAPEDISYVSEAGGVIAVPVGRNPLLIEPVPPLPPDAPPIHVTVVMHNEEPLCNPDYLADEVTFQQHRAALLDFVNMLDSHGVMLNWQSDWNFLEAVLAYDDGTGTGGLNIVEYIAGLGFDVDPHAHQTSYSYADVAYLIDQCGVPSSGVAGGFLAMPAAISELERFWGPIDGNHYEHTWQADVTWGGSFGGHGDDEAVWASGVWKPQDTGHFMTHDDNAGVATIGRYGQDWPMLQLLIDQQQNGELIPGMMYTAIVFEGQSQLIYPGVISDFEAGLLEVMGRGDLNWMGLTEQYEEWQTTYGGVPNIHRFIGFE